MLLLRIVSCDASPMPSYPEAPRPFDCPQGDVINWAMQAKFANGFFGCVHCSGILGLRGVLCC